MPELPDVETFRRYLDRTSLHQKIEDAEILKQRILTGVTADKLNADLKDHEFTGTARHGKYMFIETDKDIVMAVHFGMTGYFKYLDKNEDPPRNTRMLIRFNNDHRLAFVNRRLLGRVTLVRSSREWIERKKLGPDAVDVTEDQFIKIMRSSRGNIKAALMEQHHISGIGNIYSDEILFQSGVHPKKTVDQIDDAKIKDMFLIMKSILRTAVDKSADPEQLPGTWLIPHRKVGGPCPRCPGVVERVSLGGRSSYFCPSCQK
jgi:formamidopyrimidine-DNA glycosylase